MGETRFCSCCDAETDAQTARGNDGVFEYCPGCSFPYDFGGDGQ